MDVLIGAYELQHEALKLCEGEAQLATSHWHRFQYLQVELDHPKSICEGGGFDFVWNRIVGPVLVGLGLTIISDPLESLKRPLRNIPETRKRATIVGLEVFVVCGIREQYMRDFGGVQNIGCTRDGGEMAMSIDERLWPEEEIIDTESIIPFDGHSRSGWRSVDHIRIGACDEIFPIQGDRPNPAFE